MLSDLDKFLAGIRTNRLVQVTFIGMTVQGRELEIIRVGNPARWAMDGWSATASTPSSTSSIAIGLPA